VGVDWQELGDRRSRPYASPTTAIHDNVTEDLFDASRRFMSS